MPRFTRVAESDGLVLFRFKGVSRRSNGVWRARSLTQEGRILTLGDHSTEEGAARAVDMAAIIQNVRLFWQFAF